MKSQRKAPILSAPILLIPEWIRGSYQAAEACGDVPGMYAQPYPIHPAKL